MKPGRVSDDLIDSCDFLPTIGEATGVPPKSMGSQDGRSFLPQRKGEKGHPREWIYSWYSPRQDGDRRVREFAFNQRHKLYAGGDLYDLVADDFSIGFADPSGRQANEAYRQLQASAAFRELQANEAYRELQANQAFREIQANEAFRALQALDNGITYVNAPTIGAEAHLPFGGVKATGNGHREGGPTVIDAFTEWKSVYIDYSGKLQKAQMDIMELPYDPSFRLALCLKDLGLIDGFLRGVGSRHELIEAACRRSIAERLPLKTVLAEDPQVSRYLSPDEIEVLMMPEAYLGVATELVEQVLSKEVGNG